MKKLILFAILGLAMSSRAMVEETEAASAGVCLWENNPTGIQQYYCAGDVCPGDILYFRAAQRQPIQYAWSVGMGASIIGSSTTREIAVQSPSVGGFTITLNTGTTTYFTLAQYSCY
ncbi:MAG TPA: hypothetical protein DCE41_20650 [Cytophagales bacterium]|nr:hypothetical protein [Cytophagales bacterium]HAP59008.1 hypothetical protein [Cytophagales bacterium]